MGYKGPDRESTEITQDRQKGREGQIEASTDADINGEREARMEPA